ncbi:MAG: M48 family metallopeptidase [Burkholderiaceae bacterium]
MRLENRPPAEGINSSTDHPLKELAWLLGGSVLVVIAVVFAVSLAAQWIAPRVPYRYEARLAATLPPIATVPSTEEGRAVQRELQGLADRLSARMQLPEGMQVRVGYADSKTINAFATLGGQTVFFRGLLARLDSEDALAMVMAHEIAHLQHRHASAALGRGVAVGLILSVVSAELGRSAAADVLSQAGLATTLSFNRDQEREADDAALEVVAQEYGHLGGAMDLFRMMSALPGADSVLPQVEMLRTHPLTRSRQQVISQWAQRNNVPLDGARRPLPPAIAALRGG